MEMDDEKKPSKTARYLKIETNGEDLREIHQLIYDSPDKRFGEKSERVGIIKNNQMNAN